MNVEVSWIAQRPAVVHPVHTHGRGWLGDTAPWLLPFPRKNCQYFLQKTVEYTCKTENQPTALKFCKTRTHAHTRIFKVDKGRLTFSTSHQGIFTVGKKKFCSFFFSPLKAVHTSLKWSVTSVPSLFCLIRESDSHARKVTHYLPVNVFFWLAVHFMLVFRW